MIIHSSFVRNVWISATPSACVTLPFTYPHVLTLLKSTSLLSMMIALLALVIQLSLTYPHVPDEAHMNNHQPSNLVSIRLIFIFQSLFMYLIISKTSSRQKLRILRSGPSCHFRNNFIFAYPGITLPQIFDFKFTWNYSAMGHSKRNVNGIGGIMKQLATDATVTRKVLLKMQIHA